MIFDYCCSTLYLSGNDTFSVLSFGRVFVPLLARCLGLLAVRNLGISFRFFDKKLHSTRLLTWTSWVRSAHTALLPKSAKKREVMASLVQLSLNMNINITVNFNLRHENYIPSLPFSPILIVVGSTMNL